VRAVENAVNVKIPKNARLIRNLLHGAQFQHDHIVHFYHLHALDWVDIVSALKADPVKTAALADATSSANVGGAVYFKGVQQRLQTFVDSGQLGPFANAYWGHSAYKLPPEGNLMAAAHYIEALRLQARAARMHAIFGGKNPHPQSLVVGGVTSAMDLSPDRLAEFLYIWKETQEFVRNVYIPDLLTVASFYKDWGAIGGTTNFMAWGDFPLSDKEPESLFMPRGVIMKRDLAGVAMAEEKKVVEDVSSAWYEEGAAKHPYVGETKPKHGDYNTDKKYSWFKSPRYDGAPCEVGPLARTLVAYAKGHPAIKATVDSVLKKLDVPVTALFSTLGRTAARGIETLVVGDAMEGWFNELIENVKSGDTQTYQAWTMPDKGMGVGLNDVPRGSLSHYIVIENKKIKNYQYVVPSTWNLSGRCAKKQKGPLEEALIGTPVADAKQPLEVLRTVHSFDPCVACGVHVIDPDSNQVYKFRVL
jgi:[NiFe] hydrogenase large subunit